MAKNAPFQVDSNGNIINNSGNTITSILNVTINTSTYAAVTMPTGVFCKALIMQTRDGSPYLIATSSSPTTYMTISSPLAISIVGIPSQVLCYVKATVEGVLEVILLD